MSAPSLSLWSTLKTWLVGDPELPPMAQQIPALTEWFQSPCGQLLQTAEQELLNESLPALFGYHLMQISIHESTDLSAASPIHHRFSLLSHAPGAGQDVLERKSLLCADFTALPLESDSVDVIVLHHVLEFSPHPHQILKEVSRVLIPRGHVIIIGFNPFSLWGLWKGIVSRLGRRQAHWCFHAVTKWRLQDWFKFLDLNQVRTTDTFYRPPCGSQLLLNRLAFLEKLGKKLRLPFGGAYVMVARKEVVAVTPIRLPWEKLSRHLPGLTAAHPSTPRSYQPRHPSRKDRHLH